ncbi:MAG TPA: phosphatase PAP2 family protein [Candidatus Nitrosotalea sp.]|nr:phosphatase PAP2 family protein [Candidatus Nitrosotalea sp.]
MDYRLEQLINGPAGSHPAIDWIMTQIAWGAEPAFIALVLIWLVAGMWRRSRPDVVGALSALVASGVALVINQLAALLYFRPRPFVSHPGHVHVLLSHSADASFPSDHAAAALAISVVLQRFHPRLGALAILASLWVGYARVYVGDHYPGDVLGGYISGAVGAALALYLVRHRLELLLGRWRVGSTVGTTD